MRETQRPLHPPKQHKQNKKASEIPQNSSAFNAMTQDTLVGAVFPQEPMTHRRHLLYCFPHKKQGALK
jgi:hypothetical protein